MAITMLACCRRLRDVKLSDTGPLLRATPFPAGSRIRVCSLMMTPTVIPGRRDAVVGRA